MDKAFRSTSKTDLSCSVIVSLGLKLVKIHPMKFSLSFGVKMV
jgi:hypothetical protein